jgi:hypothetical protein
MQCPQAFQLSVCPTASAKKQVSVSLSRVHDPTWFSQSQTAPDTRIVPHAGDC